MRFLLSVIVVVLLAFSMQAQPLADKPTFPGYNDAAQLAWVLRRPLVFFYGTGYPRDVPGCIVGRQDYGVLPGFENSYGSIIIAVPNKTGWLDWKATLSATATDAQIAAAIRGQEATRRRR